MNPDQPGYRDPEIKHRQMGYVPKDGMAHNPLKGYPRNYPCVCGSEKKFKKCCMDKMKGTVKNSEAPRLLKYMKARILAVQTLKREG